MHPRALGLNKLINAFSFQVEATPLCVTFHLTAPCAWANGYLTLWNLQQFHFHWGGSDVIGSEHTVNNYRHPMEVGILVFTLKGNTDNPMTIDI